MVMRWLPFGVLVLAVSLFAACDSGLAIENADFATPGVVLGDSLIPCTDSSTCPSTLPMCDPDAGVCIGCIEGRCVGGTCNTALHVCEPIPVQPRCTRNGDCPLPGDAPAAMTCIVAVGRCAECTSSDECVAPATCDTGGVAPTYTCVTP
jgi:hypothetical protein